MEPDPQKVDAAVLALMYLTLHDGCRAWKSFDWGATARLHESGLIEDPVNQYKSIVLTERGLKAAEQAFSGLLAKR